MNDEIFGLFIIILLTIFILAIFAFFMNGCSFKSRYEITKKDDYYFLAYYKFPFGKEYIGSESSRERCIEEILKHKKKLKTKTKKEIISMEDAENLDILKEII